MTAKNRVWYVLILTLLYCASTCRGAPDPVRQKIENAIRTGRILAADAQMATPETLQGAILTPDHEVDGSIPPGFHQIGSERVFARISQVEQYESSRPWLKYYWARLRPMESTHCHSDWRRSAHWPRLREAPSLRSLLSDTDPDIRALAAEALAVLDRPEDVPLIAVLLDDKAETDRMLGWNVQMSATYLGIAGHGERDPIDIYRSWQSATVGDHARLAVQMMTGRRLTAKDFPDWWARNKDAESSIWFWEQRVRHRVADVGVGPGLPGREVSPPGLFPIGKLEEFGRLRVERLAEIRKRENAVLAEIDGELRKLSPEIEAKVRLLVDPGVRRSWEETEDTQPLGTHIRLSRERLLDLMERKDLWPDVDWNGSSYNRMVTRIASQAQKLLDRADVGRLIGILEHEAELWPPGRAALSVGISRLLPPLPIGTDDPKTRDGWLRNGIRAEKSNVVRGALTQELLSAELTGNWAFVKEQFFLEEADPYANLRVATLKVLGTPPCNDFKRRALLELLLEERFPPLWIAETGLYRKEAASAVNAHMGRTLITEQDMNDLDAVARSKQALASIAARIQVLASEPRP